MFWRVYYGDGTTFSNEDGFVYNVPTRNVQVIVQHSKEHGIELISSTDYYIWNNNRWYGVDQFGLYDYLIDPGWKRVLFGRMLTKEEYNAIWSLVSEEAKEEKTAFEKWERRPNE